MQNFKKYNFILLLGIILSQGIETRLGTFIPINPPISNSGSFNQN